MSKGRVSTAYVPFSHYYWSQISNSCLLLPPHSMSVCQLELSKWTDLLKITLSACPPNSSKNGPVLDWKSLLPGSKVFPVRPDPCSQEGKNIFDRVMFSNNLFIYPKANGNKILILHLITFITITHLCILMLSFMPLGIAFLRQKFIIFFLFMV